MSSPLLHRLPQPLYTRMQNSSYPPVGRALICEKLTPVHICVCVRVRAYLYHRQRACSHHTGPRSSDLFMAAGVGAAEPLTLHHGRNTFHMLCSCDFFLPVRVILTSSPSPACINNKSERAAPISCNSNIYEVITIRRSTARTNSTTRRR